MTGAVTFVRAAWRGRRVFGWQDWTCPVDRQVMIDEYLSANKRINRRPNSNTNQPTNTEDQP